MLLLDQSNKRDKGSHQINGKSWDFEPIFSRYFLCVLFCFMALFMARNTHSFLFSNLFSCTTNPARMQLERKKLSGTQKNCKHCSRSCAFPQSMILFSVVPVFLCQIFREKLCACVSVCAFCRADIYAKSKEEQLSTFSEKMCINDLTFGHFFAQIK